MEDSLLTKYLNSRHFYDKGIMFQNYTNQPIKKNNILHKSNKIYGGNTTSIPKYQLIKIIEEYNNEVVDDLANHMYNYLHDKFNNKHGYNLNPMEINIDEIKQLILDATKDKMNLDNNKKRNYNLIHLDSQNDELYNDISLDLLEDNEYAKIDNDYNKETFNSDDVEINTMTVEDVYDQYMVYGSPNYELYKEYITKLMNKLSDDFDENIIDSLKKTIDKNQLSFY